MTHFIDGPAKAQHLMLKRSPFFLRVTWNGKEFDALDQLGDRPRPKELLYVYYRSGNTGVAHIRMTKGSGFYPISEYRFCEPQPEQPVLHDETRFDAWCNANAKKYGYPA